MLMRYGRAQFLRDAARLGMSRETALSRSELRRRRDRLMNVHHPDRGGDARKAARINAIYARMLAWLEARDARSADLDGAPEFQPKTKRSRNAALSERLNAGASRVWGLALVAVATYAALRHRRKV